MNPPTRSPRGYPAVISSEYADELRESIRDSLRASGSATPENIAELEEFLRVCPTNRLSFLEGCYSMMKESAHTKLPQLVYRDPPPGVELHHYDIPNTEFRILFHKMIVPNTAAYAHFAFQWQFYVRSSTSQDLKHAPVVEMENPFNGRWEAITVFLAPPASALRINKQHVVRLPHDPALSVMPLNATLNE